MNYAQLPVDTTVTSKADSTLMVKEKKPKEKHFQYFRVGLDLSKLVRSSINKDYSITELLFEGVWKPKMHYVVETGFGNSNTRGDNISFSSSAYFVRLGFDKYFFGKLYKEDMDNAFIGLRIAGAHHNRKEAAVKLWDPFYGNTTITKPSANQMLYWIELTTGFRMELAKNIFIGWNIRGKTFVNPKKIQELTPNYLAGYGPAKKQPAFDYNFYILYGLGKR